MFLKKIILIAFAFEIARREDIRPWRALPCPLDRRCRQAAGRPRARPMKARHGPTDRPLIKSWQICFDLTADRARGSRPRTGQGYKVLTTATMKKWGDYASA